MWPVPRRRDPFFRLRQGHPAAAATRLSIHDVRASCGKTAWAAAVLLLSFVAVGCAERPSSQTRPSEAETREAYFDTPLIFSRAANRIPLGITRAELARELTAPAAIEVEDRAGLRCRVYPINGTEGRDEYGSPMAAEVWFCFGSDGRLERKRRFPRGS